VTEAIATAVPKAANKPDASSGAEDLTQISEPGRNAKVFYEDMRWRWDDRRY
jgi:hypothetical protein